MEEDNTIIDRISELPEFIIHDILSFLDSPSDLVRSSVLSKKWYALTASFPLFDFNIEEFNKIIQPSELRDTFFKYITYTTSRFCDQNFRLQAFNLITALQNPTEVNIVNKCLDLILDKGVQILIIDILNWKYKQQRLPIYQLPNIHLSSSSLTSLTIGGCDLPSSLFDNVVIFESLKHLHLKIVPLDEEEIEHLTTSCPFLEELIVEYCYGFERLCVYGLQNLEKVEIYFLRPLKSIDIQAPNLCCLTITSLQEERAPCMNMVSCKKLTTFYYYGYLSPISKELADMSSNFPFLENLFLTLHEECKSLKLSSRSLRIFVLHSEFDLEDIDMNTPNLLTFLYSGRSYIPFPLVKTKPSKARMECYLDADVDILWFKKLRRFLDKNNGFKELKFHISADENLMDVEELKVIQSPHYKLEHVDLELHTIKDLSVYATLVTAVLWCCCPRSITLAYYLPSIEFEELCLIVKFTYEKLHQQEDRDKTNIQIVLSSSSSNAKMHFNNLNSLLIALPHEPLTQTIKFIKEQVDQEPE